MTNNVEAEISRVLYGHLESHEFSILMPISYPGVRFDVPVKPWLSAKNHFTEVTQIGFGGEGFNRYQGFLRVDVVYPTSDVGELPALDLAGEVVTLFKRNTSLTLLTDRWVKVVLPPQVTDPLESSEWIRVPVTIRWQSDNPNVS